MVLQYIIKLFLYNINISLFIGSVWEAPKICILLGEFMVSESIYPPIQTVPTITSDDLNWNIFE